MATEINASREQGWELEDLKSCPELLLHGWASPWESQLKEVEGCVGAGELLSTHTAMYLLDLCGLKPE